MRTWEIAKLFVESCTSPEEVDQLIGTIQDRDAMAHVCEMLSAFSTKMPESSHELSKTRIDSNTESYNLSLEGKRASLTANGEKGETSAKDTTAVKLESLFRSSGMTNRKVEQWSRDNFGIQIGIGKDSLRKYLTRVLKNSDKQLKSRIVAAAEKLPVNRESPGSYLQSDLPTRAKRTGSDGNGPKGIQSIRDTSASQLVTIFRGQGMTNKEVEEWIISNFGVRILVSKKSLQKYLAKVLNEAGLGLTNRILAAAQRLDAGDTTEPSDIRTYWDEQDRHFSAVE